MTARFAELGIVVLTLAPADYGKLIINTEKWAKVGKFAGLKPD